MTTDIAVLRQEEGVGGICRSLPHHPERPPKPCAVAVRKSRKIRNHRTEEAYALVVRHFFTGCDPSGVTELGRPLHSGAAGGEKLHHHQRGRRAILTVTKGVINDNGGTMISDFPLLVDGSQVTSGDSDSFNAGLHSINEAGIPAIQPPSAETVPYTWLYLDGLG